MLCYRVMYAIEKASDVTFCDIDRRLVVVLMKGYYLIDSMVSIQVFTGPASECYSATLKCGIECLSQIFGI
ncbi:hypothetical protein [Rubritalea tangerina]|uniref:hypothetical protein n=1 Tax=Rubritalea tangerina TaxID=430798 RepID=UPI00361937BF